MENNNNNNNNNSRINETMVVANAAGEKLVSTAFMQQI